MLHLHLFTLTNILSSLYMYMFLAALLLYCTIIMLCYYLLYQGHAKVYKVIKIGSYSHRNFV